MIEPALPMASRNREVPPDVKRYPLNLSAFARFTYEIDSGSPLFRLYEKGKVRQWDARTVVDWSMPLDPTNPLALPLSTFPLARSEWFLRLPAADREAIICQYQNWLVSQFLHGEQFGVLSASRIALEAENLDVRLFAAQQAVDEVRHLETYARLIEKMGELHAPSVPFAAFLDEVISANSVDLVCLGLQIIGEGIGLASFAQIREYTGSSLVREVYARIMEDEARHVAFGRQYLAPLYRELSSAELTEREQFALAAIELMAERFYALDVWERFALPGKQAIDLLQKSASFRIYRRHLFKQIVPVVKDIGLFTAPMIRLLEGLGVHGYGDIDLVGQGAWKK